MKDRIVCNNNLEQVFQEMYFKSTMKCRKILVTDRFLNYFNACQGDSLACKLYLFSSEYKFNLCYLTNNRKLENYSKTSRLIKWIFLSKTKPMPYWIAGIPRNGELNKNNSTLLCIKWH